MELQMRIIIFSFLMVSSAAEEVKSDLNGVEGGSITFPDSVTEFGFFIYERAPAATVKDRKFEIFDGPYKERLFWNNQTGIFTIRGLRRTDSGVYTVDSKKGTVFIRSHKLTVYEPVAAPVVKALNESEDNCTLICSAEKAETTLLWKKDGETLKQSSLALSLPLTVQDFSSSYSCVAASPAEEKPVSVILAEFCRLPEKENQRPKKKIIIPIVLAVVVLLVMFIGWIFIKNKKRSETQGPMTRDSEVIYTDIQINEGRCNQMRNTRDPSRPSDRSNLTTIYDKLQVHRISNAETDDHVYDQAISFARA